jgi:glycosyltransferase involved in cell wall biosynthesis
VHSISAVVPVYNSVETLASLVERLEPVLARVATRYEIILVNDGSRDAGWEQIREIVRLRPSVKAIDLMRNYGQHNALLCGIRAASFDLIVTLDDDLQHPPEEIPKLLERIDEGADVVYGVPQTEQHGLWRDVASRITKLALQSSMGAPTARHVSAFRSFRTELRSAFDSYRAPFVSIDVLLTWATTRFSSVLVRHDPRQAGISNYTFRKLVIHALNMMTGFSTWPLQVASLLGFAFTIFGLVVLLFVLVRYFLTGGSVPGFPFLASLIAIFSGAQMFALGVMGEYLARMHFRSMERPSYAVRSRLETTQAAERNSIGPHEDAAYSAGPHRP